MSRIRPPFTEHWAFTGPNVAISCNVEWNDDQECYLATTSAGFKGAADNATAAALACFEAWMTGRRGWFEPEKP